MSFNNFSTTRMGSKALETSTVPQLTNNKRKVAKLLPPKYPPKLMRLEIREADPQPPKTDNDKESKICQISKVAKLPPRYPKLEMRKAEPQSSQVIQVGKPKQVDRKRGDFVQSAGWTTDCIPESLVSKRIQALEATMKTKENDGEKSKPQRSLLPVRIANQPTFADRDLKSKNAKRGARTPAAVARPRQCCRMVKQLTFSINRDGPDIYVLCYLFYVLLMARVR